MSSRSVTRAVIVLGAVAVAAFLALPASAAEPTPEAPVEQTIVDTAGLLDAGTIRTATLVADRIAEVTGLRITIHAQRSDNPTVAGSIGRAKDLLSTDPTVGLVWLVEQDPSGEPTTIAFAASPQFMEFVPEDALDRVMEDSVQPVLDAGDLNSATIVAAARTLMEVTGELPGGAAADPDAPADAPPPGPPFPEPEIDRAVYDFAEVFSPETIAAVEATIDRIEERTGAEAVVYTQVADFRSTEETKANALALINQWGIGRKGFDDGLAIFFNFEPGRSRGQVQLYAAPGFAASTPPAGPAAQRGDRRRWGAAGPRRPHRLGVLSLAALRQGPGVPRLAVDLRPGSSARSHRGVGRDGHGRWHIAPSPDDGHARPREPWPDRLPRGDGLPGHGSEGRRGARPDDRRRCGQSHAGPQQPQADGSGRKARAAPAPAARR